MTNYEALDRRTDDANVGGADGVAGPETDGDEGDGSRRPRKKSRGGGVGRFLRDVLIILVAAILISFLI
jgi:hypothetical protein